MALGRLPVNARERHDSERPVTDRIETPIFGVIDGDVTVFASIEEASAYIEPWDVSDGSWNLWDRQGRVLEVAVEVPDRHPITIRTSNRIDPNGLAAALSVFIGRPSPLAERPAQQVIQEFLDQHQGRVA